MCYILILLFFTSFNSFFIPFFFGKKLGLKGTFLFIICSSFFNMLCSLYLFTMILSIDSIIYIQLFNWIKIELINVSWGFLIDPLASSMLVIITYISFCAHFYSFEYLKGDPHLNRFFCYLSLFTFFMILLVLSENVLQLFIGWEGVGICSYLLINFWSNRIQANKSSILAVLANKIGDITLLIGALLLQSLYKNVSFLYIKEFALLYDEHLITQLLLVESVSFIDASYLNHLFESNDLLYYVHILNSYNSSTLESISMLLIISCIGKSAQFGFHFWLPEAMEGPTPVSSLIHAATMVTAGIFLILRFSDFFILISNSISIIILIGSITLFFASSIGLTQTDIKKVIAYSTCSQLGYMFLSCGFQNYIYSMYHLFIHAFFKALLFLTAGYLIHLLSNEQDIRKMGGLLKILPFSYGMMVIGSYALAGFPYLSGFYSKDPLIENIITIYYNSFFQSKNVLVSVSLILALCTVLFTSLYSLKSIFDIYFISYKGFYHYIAHLHYSSLFIQIPLSLLCIATIYSGYIFQEAFIGINNDFLAKSLHVSKSDYTFLFYNNCENHFNYANSLIFEYYPYNRFYLFHIITYTTISIIILKLWLSNLFYIVAETSIWGLYSSIVKKYIYINKLILYPNIIELFTNSKDIFLSLFDKGIIESFGPYGITFQVQTFSRILKLQSGYLYHYIGYIYMTLIISLLTIIIVY